MLRKWFLIVTALGEGVTGVLLLFVPVVLLVLLLGVEQAASEELVAARIAGAALLGIGVACWPGRNDHGSPAQQGLLAGVLIYDVAAAVVLAYAGWFLSLVGILLWPAVVLHAALAAWCVGCLWVKPRSQCGGTRGRLRA